jgi:hypothetical protein
MAQAWAALARVDWAQHLSIGWQLAQRSAQGAYAFLSVLPQDCKMASLHAALVCGGADPEYNAPGFGPFSLAWGWMIVGTLTGALTTYAGLSFFGMLRQRPQVVPYMQPPGPAPAPAPLAPPLAPLAPPPAPPAPTSIAPAEQVRQELLEYLATGGTAALQDLASSYGMSEAEFLMRSFGTSRSATNTGNAGSATYLTQRTAGGLIRANI